MRSETEYPKSGLADPNVQSTDNMGVAILATYLGIPMEIRCHYGVSLRSRTLTTLH